MLHFQQEKAVAVVTVPQDDDDQRLDRFLGRHFPAASFATVQKLCRKGLVRVDGKKVKDSKVNVLAGQEVRIPLSLAEGDGEEQEKRSVTLTLSASDKKAVKHMIVYEDDDILVINKPYGMPVQAGTGHTKSVDRLLAACYGKDNAPKLVHRLDKDTTGCLLLAKSRKVAKVLTENFRKRDMEKTYWCVARGRLPQHELTCTMRLAKEGGKGREKVVIHPEGQSAVTDIRLLDSGADLLWVEAKPKTGRTHQIRVHMAYLKCPLIGDIKYGGEQSKVGMELPQRTMFLHARAIAFAHPKTGKMMEFTTPAPDHFQKVFNLMGWSE